MAPLEAVVAQRLFVVLAAVRKYKNIDWSSVFQFIFIYITEFAHIHIEERILLLERSN